MLPAQRKSPSVLIENAVACQNPVLRRQRAGNPPYNLTESEPYTTSPIVLHRVLDGVAAAIEGVQRVCATSSTPLKTDDAESTPPAYPNAAPTSRRINDKVLT